MRLRASSRWRRIGEATPGDDARHDRLRHLVATVAQPTDRMSWRVLAGKTATFGPLARKGTVALLDQGIISGTRFLTTILVGRVAGPAELGLYSLAVAALILTIVIQESLVTTPYTIYWTRVRHEAQAEYTGSAFVHLTILAVMATIVLSVGAVIAQVGGFAPPTLAPILWVLAGIIPFALLKEFARRAAFAQLKMGVVFAVDAAAAAIQIGLLLALAWQDALTALTAYLAIGFACAASGVTWLFAARKTFLIRLACVGAAWRRNWGFGRWVCAGQVGGVVHGYLLYWVLAFVLGAGGTGVYAAAESMILFSNPLILGLGSLLDPESAHSLASGGQAQLLAVVKRSVLFVGSIMSVFVALLFVFGDFAMSMLYGPDFVGHGMVISILGVGALLSACSIPLSSGLKAMERPDVNFHARILAMVVTLILAFPLVTRWGVLGGAVGLLVGHVANVLVKATVFHRLAVSPSIEHPSHRDQVGL